MPSHVTSDTALGLITVHRPATKLAQALQAAVAVAAIAGILFGIRFLQ